MTKKEKKLAHYERMDKVIDEVNNNGKSTVAIFLDTFYPIVDGVVSVVDNYAERLNGKINVVVCVPRHKDNFIEKSYPVLYCHSVYLKFIGYGLAAPKSDAKFMRLLKKLRIDLIHFHSPFTMGSLAVNWAKRLDIPVVASFHTQYKQYFKKAVKLNGITAIMVGAIMNCLNRADEVWTTSEGSKRVLLSYGYRGKVRLVPNATDYVPLDNIDELSRIVCKKYGIKDNEVLFNFLGRLEVLKNILLVADALKIVKDAGIKFKMIYIGSGLDKHLLERKIEELGLKNEVIIAGLILEKEIIAALLNRSSLQILPSIHDLDPIVKYEAATFNTPTLLLKDSCASYGTKDGFNSFVAEGTKEKIAEKIIEVVNNRKLLLEVGKNAHDTLYRHWDSVMADVQRIYLELIKNHKKTAK